jgi:hypothetical protein
MERGAFAAPHESGNGPTLPSAASAGHGSYLGISCRQRRCGTTGENDPNLPPAIAISPIT